MPDIVRCRFPFPPHDPPVRMPEGCTGRCPNARGDAFATHAQIAADDESLLLALRDFAAWFYAPGQPRELVDEQVRHAAILYTREDHDGTCIPKTILFMHYKHLQYASGGAVLRLSDAAARALKGEEVASWPDGERASGPTWNQMFAAYSLRYDEPTGI